MRRYEVVFVLAPNLTEEEVQAQISTFSSSAEEMGAKILQVDEWGKRRLAFPVKKFSDGIYVCITLEEEAAKAVAELERRFKVAESVIRFLTVRIDEHLNRAEKFKQKREARQAKRNKASRPAREEQHSSEESKAEEQEED